MSPLLRRPIKSSGKSKSKKPGERLVTLVGKPGCHLCDDAREVVARVCGEVGVPWEEKDINRDEELHRLYREEIPVVLVDGEQHTFWRVDPVRLRRALGA
ncbi:glutaredoxin family protein [Streptomyces sp. NPDC051219]|uniref:glutaredoxin family protein n=1 Tax=Streptomyces sp. NPDC051219 TaxID=3155283 RepID=UPI003438952F